MIHKQLRFWVFVFLAFVLGQMTMERALDAAELRLSWSDNSNDEDGFIIERRVGQSGSFAQHATVQANATSYTDPNLANGTTYCYRVKGFNVAGSSDYTNESCETTPASMFNVNITRSGTGTGTVTSSPAGINCGSDCSEGYTKGATVTLTAAAASGSKFTGWTGSADCTDGQLTVNADTPCTATFDLIPGYTLTTSVIRQISSGGSGDGRIVSSPAGIDCGADCSESYLSGAVVSLTAVPAANSKFTGWSGHADCLDGSVTLDGNKTCSATFTSSAATLTVAKSGNGTVVSTPAGIDCGSACSYSFGNGSTVSLKAVAAPGFVFAGWSGAGCNGTGTCSVSVASSTTVTANFVADLTDKIGVYRPSTGEWFLDRNGNETWDGCEVDLCVKAFAGTDGTPVVGDWNGSGSTKIGLYVSAADGLRLDANGNGKWDGCEIDICTGKFGENGDAPISGRWSTTENDWVGTFRVKQKKWLLDSNRDGILNCNRADECRGWSNYKQGDLPITGDWTGHGKTLLGLFRPRTGEWFLEAGNGTWNGCSKETCLKGFGSSGDLPVSGDWNGTGKSKVGVFRPSTGEWYLDLNGNGKWDGCGLDACLAQFGSEGDIPVVGKW